MFTLPSISFKFQSLRRHRKQYLCRCFRFSCVIVTVVAAVVVGGIVVWVDVAPLIFSQSTKLIIAKNNNDKRLKRPHKFLYRGFLIQIARIYMVKSHHHIHSFIYLFVRTHSHAYRTYYRTELKLL